MRKLVAVNDEAQFQGSIRRTRRPLRVEVQSAELPVRVFARPV